MNIKIPIDSHCHLQYFSQEEQEQILKKCEEKSMEMLINISCEGDEGVLPHLINLTNIKIFFSVGYHPSYEKIISKDDLIQKIQQHKPIALGETGVDCFKYKNNLATQLLNFEIHIQVGLEFNLPIIIHGRDSFDEIEKIIIKYPQGRYLFHCFSGDINFVNKMLHFNTMFSFSGNITYKSNIEIHKVIEQIPIDRFIFETDSPFLIPYNYRKEKIHQHNKPYLIQEVCEFFSIIKKISYEEALLLSKKNFEKFFYL